MTHQSHGHSDETANSHFTAPAEGERRATDCGNKAGLKFTRKGPYSLCLGVACVGNSGKGGSNMKALFSIGWSEFEKDLGNRDFSERLRQQFENNGIKPPQNVTIQAGEQYNTWVVSDVDENMLYAFQREDDDINVYDIGNGDPRDVGPEECKVARLAIIIGRRGDDSLVNAENWSVERAKALGGNFMLWRSFSSGSPLEQLSAADISNGQINHQGRYHENPRGNESGFDQLLPDFADCKGRIEELVIFHHGSPVDEAEVAAQILKIFQSIRVPVCRIVWWTCNAAVSLQVGEGEWTDSFMKKMGGLARCKPCGCDSPIELVWPTNGKCAIRNDVPITNSGQVHRLRWGYPQAGGGLGARPDPNDPQPTRNPPDREPPYGQDPPTEPGTVFDEPVQQGSV